MASGYIGTGAADRDPAIGNDTVTSSKISDDAVTAAKINILDDTLAATDAHIMVADGTDFGNVAISGDVTMTNAGVVTIANTSVENAMMAVNSVDSDQYVDGSIDTDHISANAVDGTKIAMGSDAAGDVLTYTGTDYVRLAKGTAGQALIMNGGATAVEWGSAGASLSSAQSWTGPQRGTPSTVTNGTLDLDTANNFLYTPAAADVLEFSNETAGQAGFITLINPSAYTISLGGEVKKGASWDVSTAGTYLVSYYSDGTSVYVSASEALS